MAKFIGESKSVDNSKLTPLNNFFPSNKTTTQITTINGVEYQKSSVYKNGNLIVEVRADGLLQYTLKTDIAEKKLTSVFEGNSWEKKFFRGDDTIKGSTDSDMLYGFDGSDEINGRAGNDTIYGGDMLDALNGGGGNDSLFGGDRKDVLNGGAGINSLTGNSGKDTFAFDTALNAGNYSKITDFQHGADTIELAKSTFAGIGSKGALGGGKFFLASNYTGKANSVVYDKSNGNLYYAKDGGDISNAQMFAKITNLAPLDHIDFVIA